MSFDDADGEAAKSHEITPKESKSIDKFVDMYAREREVGQRQHPGERDPTKAESERSSQMEMNRRDQKAKEVQMKDKKKTRQRSSKSALPVGKPQNGDGLPNPKKDEFSLRNAAEKKESKTRPDMNAQDVQHFLALVQNQDDFDKFQSLCDKFDIRDVVEFN